MDYQTAVEQLVSCFQSADKYKGCKGYKDRMTTHPDVSKVICSAIQETLTDGTPMAKLLALRLAKETVEMKHLPYLKIFQDKILLRMKNIAQFRKEDAQETRGKFLFSDSPSKEISQIGHSVFRLCLDGIRVWANWFPVDPDTMEKSMFKKTYEALVAQNVEFGKLTYYKESDLIPEEFPEKRVEPEETIQKAKAFLKLIKGELEYVGDLLNGDGNDEEIGMLEEQVAEMQKNNSILEQYVMDLINSKEEQLLMELIAKQDFYTSFIKDYQQYKNFKVTLKNLKQKYSSICSETPNPDWQTPQPPEQQPSQIQKHASIHQQPQQQQQQQFQQDQIKYQSEPIKHQQDIIKHQSDPIKYQYDTIKHQQEPIKSQQQQSPQEQFQQQPTTQHKQPQSQTVDDIVESKQYQDSSKLEHKRQQSLIQQNSMPEQINDEEPIHPISMIHKPKFNENTKENDQKEHPASQIIKQSKQTITIHPTIHAQLNQIDNLDYEEISEKPIYQVQHSRINLSEVKQQSRSREQSSINHELDLVIDEESQSRKINISLQNKVSSPQTLRLSSIQQNRSSSLQQERRPRNTQLQMETTYQQSQEPNKVQLLEQQLIQLQQQLQLKDSDRMYENQLLSEENNQLKKTISLLHEQHEKKQLQQQSKIEELIIQKMKLSDKIVAQQLQGQNEQSIQIIKESQRLQQVIHELNEQYEDIKHQKNQLKDENYKLQQLLNQKSKEIEQWQREYKLLQEQLDNSKEIKKRSGSVGLDNTAISDSRMNNTSISNATGQVGVRPSWIAESRKLSKQIRIRTPQRIQMTENQRILIYPFTNPQEYYTDKIKQHHKGKLVSIYSEWYNVKLDQQSRTNLAMSILTNQAFLSENKYFKIGCQITKCKDNELTINLFYLNSNKLTAYKLQSKLILSQGLRSEDQVDSQILVYENSEEAQKIDIEIVKVPFNPSQLQIQLIANKQMNFEIYLPITLLPFCNFSKISLKEYAQLWKSNQRYLVRSNLFEYNVDIIGVSEDLCKYFTLIELNTHKREEYLAGLDEIKYGGIFQCRGSRYIIRFTLTPNNKLLIQIAMTLGKIDLSDFLVNTLQFIFQN